MIKLIIGILLMGTLAGLFYGPIILLVICTLVSGLILIIIGLEEILR